MKDKKNIVIAILSGIIILGLGYMLGKKNTNSYTLFTSTTTSSTRHEYSSTTTSISTESTSFHDVEKTEITSDSLVPIQDKTAEEIAFDKMASLKGTWAVWQSDNNFTIHEDSTWTTRQHGPGGDRTLDVEVVDYDEYSNTLNIILEGTYTQIRIINEKEIILDSGENGGTSKFILIE